MARGKALVPLLGVLAALAIGVAAVAIVLQMQERDKRVATERELMIALAEKDDVKAQLRDEQKAKAKVEKELSLTQGTLLQTTSELETALTVQETLSKAVEDRQKEIERITKDLEQARRAHEQLALNLRAQRTGFERQVKDLETAKGELETKVLELSEQPTVELDKIVVSEAPAPTGDFRSDFVTPVSLTRSGFTDGQVIVVNREYDFVVMNLGKNQGLSIGQEFHVVRDAEVIGKVKVEKIYDELSAAAILPESDKSLIQEGDDVRAL